MKWVFRLGIVSAIVVMISVLVTGGAAEWEQLTWLSVIIVQFFCLNNLHNALSRRVGPGHDHPAGMI